MFCYHKTYYVLNPRGEDNHAGASRAALRTYAEAIKRSDPTLARDIEEWVRMEEPKVVDLANYCPAPNPSPEKSTWTQEKREAWLGALRSMRDTLEAIVPPWEQ